MAQYIDKAALVAEIERIKKEECPIDTYEGRNKLFYFERFLSFLNTIEVKDVDLDEEIEKCLKRHSMLALGKKDFTDIAKQFFELGIKAQKGE